MEFARIPEGIMAQMLAEQDRARMAGEAVKNEIYSFLGELTPVQLVTMRHIIQLSTQSEQWPPFMDGQISAMLRLVYDVCTDCGHNHVGENLKGDCTPDTGEAVKVEDLNLDKPSVHLPAPGSTGAPETKEEAALFSVATAEVAEFGPERYTELLEQYNLRFHEDPAIMHLQCKGCGLTYVSLKDRMLREPDDCHGCHVKSAHG